MVKKVHLFTDGACLGNPGPGGWAALLRFGKTEKILQGGAADTTNNRMELMAVIEGLQALKQKCHVEITTDSKYILNAFELGWLRSWQMNGWRTADKKPVKNQDLWLELVEQTAKHQLVWTWVKGHAGHDENERVDDLARQQAKIFARSGGAF